MGQPGQDFRDLRRAGVLVSVVRQGLPERDHAPVDGDWPLNVHYTDGWTLDGVQPSGERYCPFGVIDVSAGAGDAGTDGILQAPDRSRT
jgi:hypothetical protein